jgi:quercetin dioxygenase-like cupin family protein
MERDDFIEMLAREGFQTTVLVEREAGASLEDHAHAFEAKALILEGELTLRVHNTDTRYLPGDVFHLRANETHSDVTVPKASAIWWAGNS